MPDPIVVALIAFMGALVGILAQPFLQTLNTFLARATERATLLREKREEIIMSLLDHESWFEKNCRDLEQLYRQATSLGRARALQRLYFPSEREVMNGVSTTLADFRAFMWDCQEHGGLNYTTDADDREYLERYQSHVERVNACIEAITSKTQSEASPSSTI